MESLQAWMFCSGGERFGDRLSLRWDLPVKVSEVRSLGSPLTLFGRETWHERPLLIG